MASTLDYREYSKDQKHQEKESFRGQLIDRLLVIYCLVNTFAYLLVILRSDFLGWGPREYIQTGLLTSLYFVYFGRKRFSSVEKANYLILFSVIVGCLGILTLGVFAGGAFYLPIAAVLIALFYSVHTILLFLISTTLFYLYVAQGFVSGELELARAATDMHQSKTVWFVYLCSIGIFYAVTFSVILGFRKENKFMVSNLENQVNERTHQYEVERDAANQAREAAEMLVRVADFSGQGIGWATLDTKVQYFNQALKYMLELPPGVDVRNYSFNDFYHPEELEMLSSQVIPAVMSDGFWTGEIPLKALSGRTIPTIHNVFLVKDNNGENMAFANVVTDITERKQQEQLLVKAKEEAQRANAAKTEFLSRMSHELRTPLNAILGFSELMKSQTNINETDMENLVEISSAGKHLLSLVNDVLDLSQMEEGFFHIEISEVDLAGVMEACVSQIKPLLEARGITISVNGVEKIYLLADKMRLIQVLLNLLSNAVKYNVPQGKIEIEASQQGNVCRVSVKDTGRGIDPEKLNRLFSPFERLQSSYEGVEGTGIGLAISKKLIERMSGKIGYAKREEQGSEFWFELPWVEPPITQIDSIKSNEEKPGKVELAARELSSSHYPVLYVEDNEANMHLMEQIFTLRPDLELIKASSAEQALSVLQDCKPALILLDINLPDRNGFEILKDIRSNPDIAEVPVIALTANAMKTDKEKAMEAGFDNYVAKPLDIPLFLTLLDEQLSAHQ